MNFALFCEFWCFSLGKQARFTLNFCSGMPLRKVHELTFLWFGLPGPLLIVRPEKWDHSQVGFRGSHAPFCLIVLLLGARCLQNGHFGRISSTLYFAVFQSLALGGHASARRVLHEQCLPPGALFHAGAFAFPPCSPRSHMRPLGGFQ